MRNQRRQRYILFATLGYAGLALSWIFLSDQLLAAFVNLESVLWLSIAKGLFFVLVTALALYFALQGVPEKAGKQATVSANFLLDQLPPRSWPRLLTYGLAVGLVLAMLWVRANLPVGFGERPLLILFMLPVILAALLGGLGPGLAATLTAAGVTAFNIPPAGRLAIDAAHDLFQWSLLITAGLTVSVVAEALHQVRRRERARRQELEAANATLRRSEARFEATFDQAAVGIGLVAPDGRWLRVNRRLREIAGYRRDELLGLTVRDLTHADDLDADQDYSRRMLAGEISSYAMEKRYRRKDGGTVRINLTVALVRKPEGGPDYFIFVIEDITERKQTEEALRESEERYRSLVNNLPGMAYRCLNDQRWTMLFFSEGIEQVTGYPTSDFIDNAVRSYVSIIHPADRAAVEQAVQEAVKANRPYEMEYRLCRAGGTTIWVYEKGRGIYGPTGKVLWLDGVIIDISQRKSAEEEKERLQAQLTQAQKMESVGRLAGGVAHDFNNMLSVISGHAELALMQVAPEGQLFTDLQEIFKAARRSADLTRQLLAFARKQTVVPRILDLNETVANMCKMLKRLIGEDIDLAWRPGDTRGPVEMDPAQLDQILANLCVNARDAIRDTGRITIETGSAVFDQACCRDHAGSAPGEYVLLAVSDDGCGMDSDTRSHLFEPFFTTKKLGKGTGLGLATVYGIVKQNRGFIEVVSEPDQGAAFKIYLPRYTGEGEEPGEQEAAPVPGRGTETILLVEDEPAILKMTGLMLQRQGYTVLAADRPEEAIRLAREHGGPIHLLITDVVMPGMNGRELVGQLQTIHPDLECLFMSGYTADVIAHHGVLDQDVHFLQKPFSMDDLARTVRKVLDR